MIRQLIHFSFFLLLCSIQAGYAQQLTKVAENDAFTDYVVNNEDLGIYSAYELTAPVVNGNAQFSILEQSVSENPMLITLQKAQALALSSSERPLVETLYQGLYRGQQTASLKINLARFSENSTLITRNIKIRVFKSDAKNVVQSKKLKASDHPLSSGDWYKIPVSKKGIYQIDRQYLENLGIDPSTVNPRNIQLWGTDGYVLPEPNSTERPEFSQIPILVEGEGNNSFDENDRVIFFGNSPHQETQTQLTFNHKLHPYSDTSFVFLTIGSSPGIRLSESNTGLSPTATVTTFEDFIWKEEELTKSETRQKSGRFWLGQRIPASSQNQFITVFKDTLPGIIEGSNIRISGRYYSRAESTPSFETQINNEPFQDFSISRLSVSAGYNSYEGVSARAFTFGNNSFSPNIENGILEMIFKMYNTDSGANAFIDYLTFVVERSLIAENNRLFFFPPAGGSVDEIADFTLQGFSSTPFAMDVSDPMQPRLLRVTENGANHSLVYHTALNTKLMVQSSLFTPGSGRLVPNQNLHNTTTYPDYIVVTSEFFREQAQELADYRVQSGLTPLVVTQNQILNEFSGGSTDPTAIRDFLKYLWDLAIADGQTPPKYLLLFGDTTYDTKNILANSFTNHVLTFQSEESINRTGTYGSDDYFGLMDTSEGVLNTSSRVDLGIGRISAQTRSEASIAIDKIKRYENPANDGDWQNLFTFAGDDDFPEPIANRDLHVENADGTARRLNLNVPGARLKKIYLFDYPDETTGAGRQIPAATEDLMNTLNNGTLLFNYSGHGNAQTLTDEELFRSEYISELTNRDRLALVVTATCQFGRYDDINAQSGAEKLVFADNGGAIASFTTTRVVYTSSNPNSLNYGLNINLSQKMLEREADGTPLRFGDIVLRTKNTSIGGEANSRKFILLGDPATRIALPDKAVHTETINGVNVAENDTVLTIKALDQVNMSGYVSTQDGTLLSDFSGEVIVTLFDAPRTISIPQDREWVESRGCNLNAGTDQECTYTAENDVLFKGKTIVENGLFDLSFIIPKDISFSPDNGRVILFASNGITTAGGSYSDIIFNGINTTAVNDGKGPALDIFLNDESFINGSLSSDSPKLIVELADSSGINTTGTGVGHEIIATIDTKPQQTFVLNNFYEGALNDFTKGRIEYPLDEIPEGNYALKVRAWDVHNNPSEKEIFFEIASEDELVVDNIYNYPNPMNNRTSFTFEHNQQGNPLEVDIRIYTLSGKPVQQLKEYIQNTSSSYASIPWNGRDRDNDRLGNGTYIYVLRVTADTPEGRQSTRKIEKLVIIR